MRHQDIGQAENRSALIARLERAHCEVRDSTSSGGLLIFCRGIDRHLPLPRGWEPHFTRFFAPRLRLEGSRLTLSYFGSPWHRCVHAGIFALFLGDHLFGNSGLSLAQAVLAMITAQLVPVAMAHRDFVVVRELLKPHSPPLPSAGG